MAIGVVQVQQGEQASGHMARFFIMNWTVYILFSQKLNRFYVGYSHQPDIRLLQHLSFLKGNTAFTAKAQDWKQLLCLSCRDETHARKVESHIKKMKSKAFIINLIKYPELQRKVLSRY